MKITLLPDDRRQLPSKITELEEELGANGHEPTATRRLRDQLTQLRSLKVETSVYTYVPPTCDRVGVGTVATVNFGKKQRRFAIAGVVTFVPGRLPCCDPIARALSGKSVGEEVLIGDDQYRVVAIEPIACT